MKEPLADGKTGERTTLYPGCKINLYLRILGRREDGMHELETLFHPLQEPSDRIEVEVLPQGNGSGLRFTCSSPDLAGPENLVVRAYHSFAAVCGFAPRLRVHLDKRTPVGAGLGGGSADAAAMLRFLNHCAAREGAAPSRNGLKALAIGLGADVSFFLQDEPALARGVGELLRPLPEARNMLSGLHIVLCMPRLRVSTAWAYAAWDERFPGGPNGLTAFPAEDMNMFCLESLVLYNGFEDVVLPAYPALRELKEQLLRHGAQGALLSGSGASVFGVFRQEGAALEAQQALARAEIVTVCIPASTGVSPS